MPEYFVNKQPQSNGDHEVHKSGCSFLPDKENRIPLGNFFNCSDAVQEAKKHYTQVNGCYYCSSECHTG